MPEAPGALAWLATLEVGHELDACRLEHPLVGTLRCGEWFLFAAVHDLMHLEQLADLAARHGGADAAGASDAAAGGGRP